MACEERLTLSRSFSRTAEITVSESLFQFMAQRLAEGVLRQCIGNDPGDHSPAS
jgi:hypothetical protein